MADTTITENRVQHTPGPWKVRAGSWCEDGIVQFEIEPIRNLCAADANLIAAAPDLYAVLRESVDAFDARTASGDVLPPSVDVSDRVARARAVLAKAEGR